MNKFLQHVRKKPESTRRKILFGATLSVTFVIIVFWIFTLKYDANKETHISPKENAKPFSMLKDIFKNANESMSASVKALRGTVSPKDSAPDSPGNTA